MAKKYTAGSLSKVECKGELRNAWHVLSRLHLRMIEACKNADYNDKELELLVRIKFDIDDVIKKIDGWDQVPF